MSEQHTFGCVLSPDDERDYQTKDYVTMGVRPRTWMPKKLAPVLNQGQVGSCVAHTLATMKWYHEYRERKSEENYSTDFIYHNRRADDYQGYGMMVREAVRNLTEDGVVKHHLLPTNTEYPSQVCKDFILALLPEATEFKGKSYVRARTKDEICEAIYQHGAVCVAIKVMASFNSFYFRDDDTMTLPLPLPDEHFYGYHAITAIGYTEQGIVIQNSWGEHWGNKGLAILPWDYEINEAWFVIDEVKLWNMLEFKIGEKEYKKNGELITADVAPFIEDDRTFVPLRIVAEALGADVEWIADEQKIIIRKEV